MIPPPHLFTSMHADWREIMAARQMEGKAAIGHQRKALTVRRIDRVDDIGPVKLLTQLVGQFGHRDRAHIDDARAAFGKSVEWNFHIFTHCPR